MAEPPAGFARRLGAIAYDLLIVAALLIIATAPVLLANGGQPVAAGTGWYQAYLLTVVGGYFTFFWWRRGQTIGMVAWRLAIRDKHDQPVSLGRAVLRAGTAGLSLVPAGLGFAWMLIDRERRTWHDLLSGTRIVVRR